MKIPHARLRALLLFGLLARLHDLELPHLVRKGLSGPTDVAVLWLAEMSSAESGIDSFSPKREL